MIENKNNKKKKKGLSTKKRVIIITTILLIGAVILFSWTKLPYLKNLQITHVGKDEDNLESGKSTKYPKKAIIEYKVSFKYLGSRDNIPIEKALFLVFPCPQIDNEVVIDTEEGDDESPKLENIRWQLWSQYENNEENILQLEMENGSFVEPVKPRESSPLVHEPWLQDTSHGPKIWFQFSMTHKADAFHIGEEARAVVSFAVPENKKEELSLKDNQGGVFFGANAYRMEGYMPIHYSVNVSIFSEVSGESKRVKEFGATGENLARYSWIKLNSKA